MSNQLAHVVARPAPPLLVEPLHVATAPMRARSIFAPPATRASMGNLFAPPGQVGLPSGRVPSQGSGWTFKEIGYKDVGTAQTIEVMRELAVAGSQHPGIRVAVERVTRGLPSKDYEAELRALFELVRQHVRYNLDPRSLELVQHPAYTMFVNGLGDCDDSSALIAALALAAGHGAAFRTIRTDPRRPDEFSHVYPVIGYRDRDGEHWFAADVTHPRPETATWGWEAPEEARFGTQDWVLAPA